MSGVFIREELQTQRVSCDDGCRDWSYAAPASQGIPETASQPLEARRS